MTRQDNKIGGKVMVVITTDQVNGAMRVAIEEMQKLLDIKSEELLYLTADEANQLADRFTFSNVLKRTSTNKGLNTTDKLNSAQKGTENNLVKKMQGLAAGALLGKCKSFNCQLLSVFLVEE